jgi:hypothetical protein
MKVIIAILAVVSGLFFFRKKKKACPRVTNIEGYLE